jgi:hypothetical protein
MNTDSHRQLPSHRSTTHQAKNPGRGRYRNSPPSAWRPLAALLIAFALQGMTACGSGGDGGSTPIVQQPVVPDPDPPDDETNVFVHDRQTSGCTLMNE